MDSVQIKKPFSISIIILNLSLIAYLFSIFFAKSNTLQSFRWLAFGLHILAIAVIALFYISKTLNKRVLSKVSEKEIVIFIFILIITEILSLSFLQDYPFVSVGDEVRDGGLNAMQIANGALVNIFSYGRYDAHGLIIPTISAFFYNIFGNSVLTYRLPAALLSILDIAIIFILVRFLLSKTAAFFSALTLATLPLHLFFARTQIVVAFNSFWSSFILLFLFILFKKGRTIDYVFLGTILGFAGGFHAAIRTMVILVLLTVITVDLWTIIKKLVKKEKKFHNLQKIFLLIVFFLVGFGPRILFSDTLNFFHTSRLSLSDLYTTETRYIKSLMVWGYEKTTFFYPDHNPILSPILAVFFLLGIGYSLFILKKKYLYILIFLSVSLPFFNSSITDWINADHRISPLLPIGAIFAGMGINYVLNLISNKNLKFIIGGIIFIYLLFKACGFFTDLPANKNYNIKDYLSMHIIYFIKSQSSNKLTNSVYAQTTDSKNICIWVSPDNYYNLNLTHYLEQYKYFLPDKIIEIKEDTNIKNNESYIFKQECPVNYKITTKEKIIKCNLFEKNFYCPLNSSDNIVIHY